MMNEPRECHDCGAFLNDTEAEFCSDCEVDVDPDGDHA